MFLLLGGEIRAKVVRDEMTMPAGNSNDSTIMTLSDMENILDLAGRTNHWHL